MVERRRLARVMPFQAIPVRMSGERAYALDLSLSGLKLGYQYFFEVGAEVIVFFKWEERPVELTCVLQWSRVQRVGRGASDKAFYEAGVSFEAADLASRSALRDCIDTIEKANVAPAIAARSDHAGSAYTFARHEYVDGLWRKMVTTQTDQPIFGFTVAAEQPSHDVSRLRDAYVTADDPTRDVIRKLAKLSITNEEPSPIRR
jgi:hypothetical protein